MIEFKIDDKKLRADLKKIDTLNNPNSKFLQRTMERLGANQNRWIKRRLMKGEGLKGRFKGYSLQYREYRAEKHRQAANVDLNFTGSYWKSFGVQYDRKTGSVMMAPGIGGALKFHSELGIKHDRGLKVPKREHWGFTREDRKKHLHNFMMDRVAELKRINPGL